MEALNSLQQIYSQLGQLLQQSQQQIQHQIDIQSQQIQTIHCQLSVVNRFPTKHSAFLKTNETTTHQVNPQQDLFAMIFPP